MKFSLSSAILAAALLAAVPASAAVPGFAGNITGGGSATPIVVSTLAQAQSAMNNYNGTSGLVLHYNGTFDEQAILNNICGQWSKPATELSISGKNNITILGIDEAQSAQQQVSWISPVARALLKARVGDVVRLVTPAGGQDIEVLEVRYPAPG